MKPNKSLVNVLSVVLLSNFCTLFFLFVFAMILQCVYFSDIISPQFWLDISTAEGCWLLLTLSSFKREKGGKKLP